MQNFQDTFQTRKQSFISAFSICMTVPLSIFGDSHSSMSNICGIIQTFACLYRWSYQFQIIPASMVRKTLKIVKIIEKLKKKIRWAKLSLIYSYLVIFRQVTEICWLLWMFLEHDGKPLLWQKRSVKNAHKNRDDVCLDKDESF